MKSVCATFAARLVRRASVGSDSAAAYLTLLQKRTAETPRAQRTLKTNTMDAWRSMRVRDARENLPLRTPRLCGDIPFLQRPQYFFKVHQPSASQDEARLRGLYRIISSKTIRPRLCTAKPACAGYTGLCIQRPSFRSPDKLHTIAVLRYVDPCPGLPCRARCPLLAERSTSCENCDVPKYISAYFSRRPKFISVAKWGARW